jgi:hypothetical protein
MSRRAPQTLAWADLKGAVSKARQEIYQLMERVRTHAARVR